MKRSEDLDNIYNDEPPIRRIPNEGREEIQIEPIDWDDI